MIRSFLVGTAACLTVALACLASPQLRAADGTGNEVLKKHGLKMAGSLAVATEEPEIKTKLSDARRLSKQLSQSLMQQKATMSPEEMQKTVKTLGARINDLKSELNAVNQQMNQVPRSNNNAGYGRFGSGIGYGNNGGMGYGNNGGLGYANNGGMSFANNNAAELYSELLAYRTQVQAEIEQDSYFLNQLKSQPADPKAKEKIDSDVRDRRDAYHEAILELRKLVDSATAKYDEFATNVEVKKALDAIGKGQREKPKLGPSHDFQTNVKTVEKLEQAESSGDKEDTQAKPARRGRRSTKTKQSSKTANAAANSSGTP
jgi:uncharacterized coiled-coil DUF342 family protein